MAIWRMPDIIAFIIVAPIWDGRLVSETLPSLIIELSIFGLIAFIAAWKFKDKNPMMEMNLIDNR